LNTLVLGGPVQRYCKARFLLAAEHPDHDAYERSDKNKKVDCHATVTHLAIVPLRARQTAVNNGGAV
jgi:hypothetical protein